MAPKAIFPLAPCLGPIYVAPLAATTTPSHSIVEGLSPLVLVEENFEYLERNFTGCPATSFAFPTLPAGGLIEGGSKFSSDSFLIKSLLIRTRFGGRSF